jgi:hypothetical protein
MNNTETVPAPSAPSAAPKSSIPATYEDCMTIIDACLSSSSAADDNTKAELRRLKAFFEKRIGKRSAEAERDGVGALKRTFDAKPAFTKYEPKPLEPAKVTEASPWK